MSDLQGTSKPQHKEMIGDFRHFSSLVLSSLWRLR